MRACLVETVRVQLSSSGSSWTIPGNCSIELSEVILVVSPSRAAPPTDPSAGASAAASVSREASSASGPPLFPAKADGAARGSGGGGGGVRDPPAAAFWGFTAEDVSGLGYASITEGIASIASSVSALLQGLKVSASNVTVRIEMPAASQPAPGSSVTASPLASDRTSTAGAAAGMAPASATGDPVIPVIIVCLSRVDYEDRTGGSTDGSSAAAWQRSPPGARTGLGAAVTEELEVSPFRPARGRQPQEQEQQRRALKRIAKHVSILGLEVDLTSGRPMCVEASDAEAGAACENLPDGGSDGDVDPNHHRPLQSTHLLWGPEGEPGISMGISVSMEWEAGLRNLPEGDRRRHGGHPSCISVEVSLEPFTLSLTPGQSPCLAAAVLLMRRHQEDGAGGSGPPPCLVRQPSGGGRLPAGGAAVCSSASSSGSLISGTPEQRPTHPEGRPPRRYDDYLGAPRHQSHGLPYGDVDRPYTDWQYGGRESWGRKSFMEELLLPDCERLVLASLEPCAVRSLSLAEGA